MKKIVARLKSAEGRIKMKKITGVIISLMFVFFLSSSAVSAKEATGKTMNVSATVDVGQNTKDLLEQGGKAMNKIIDGLANQLGMGVEKIFPYYVKQVSVHATASMIVWAVITVIIFLLNVKVFLLYCKYRKNRKEKKNDDDVDSCNMCGFLSVILLVIFIIDLFIGLGYLSDWITMVSNPQYTAIQNMLDDASKLVRR